MKNSYWYYLRPYGYDNEDGTTTYIVSRETLGSGFTTTNLIIANGRIGSALFVSQEQREELFNAPWGTFYKIKVTGGNDDIVKFIKVK